LIALVGGGGYDLCVVAAFQFLERKVDPVILISLVAFCAFVGSARDLALFVSPLLR
jgi:hypothetical protein